MDQLLENFLLHNPSYRDYQVSPQTDFLDQPGDLYTRRDATYILDDSTFIKKKIKQDYFVGKGVLMIYSNTCPHCRKIAPQIRTLAHHMNIYVFDADNNPHHAGFFGIRVVPSFFIVDETGMVTEETNYDQFIENAYAMQSEQ
jgi:thiol-disulfide isomerase/thioredoxin